MQEQFLQPDFDTPISQDGHAFLKFVHFDENAHEMVGGKPDQLISGRGRVTSVFCKQMSDVYHSGWHATHTVFHCTMQGCPDCFRYWAGKLATKAASFLVTQHSLDAPIFHCTISPPDGAQFCGWKNLIRKMYVFLRKFHSTSREVGWCYVLHPRRFQCFDCGNSMEHWKGQPCSRCKSIHPPIWKWSPHIHLVTNFWASDDPMSLWKMKRHLKRAGMVFVNISLKNEDYFTSEQHMVNVVKYELGHALWKPREKGRGKGAKALVWVGAWHPNHLKRWYEKTSEEVLDELDSPFRAIAAHDILGGEGWQADYSALGGFVYLDKPNLARVKFNCRFDVENKPVPEEHSIYEEHGTVPEIKIVTPKWAKELLKAKAMKPIDWLDHAKVSANKARPGKLDVPWNITDWGPLDITPEMRVRQAQRDHEELRRLNAEAAGGDYA